VGPFIGKQLIQKLVTSEPTPAYVARVTAVFDNNGAGMRGDLRAVVRAILMDPEARGARKIDPAYGKLVEPALFMTSLARAANARSDGVTFRNSSNAWASSSSTRPRCSTTTRSTTSCRARGSPARNSACRRPPPPSRARISRPPRLRQFDPARQRRVRRHGNHARSRSYQSVAQDAAALAARLDRALLAGRMSTAMRDAIVSAVNAIPASDTLNRARDALWLVVTSPQFQVQR
jgi:hypothetical protein